MNFLRYVRHIAIIAVSHSLSVAQNIIFVAVIIVGFIVKYAPGPHIGIDFRGWASPISGWEITAYVFCFILGLRLLLANFWIYQDLQATIAAQRTQLETLPVKQNSEHIAIRIEFQPTEPFMRKTIFPAGNARFEVYVKIKNCGNGFISECVASVVDITPKPDNNGYTILTPLNSLAKGEHRYVLVAGFNEVAMTGQQIYNDLVTFAFATGGLFRGFTTLQPPSAAEPALITIEAKALECRTERKQFKLWVGENRRLCMAET
jgi:hypothetical protein